MKSIVCIILVYFTSHIFVPQVSAAERFFEVQAIDTMKTSRDRARAGASNETIDKQVQAIAETGATHVAIGTPYDAEFIPYMKRWVESARKHKLKVWFRGNMAGWEGWFEYPKITRDEHKTEIRKFILANPDLFEDGDVFVSCPECENGGPGDPRQTGDTEGFRKFIREEYNLTYRAFQRINKNVIINYYSMNGDVARLIMDKTMTSKIGGIVTIDHYVETPEELLRDVDMYAAESGGKVVLGEWGAPIPDIHGEMSEVEQAAWLEDSLSKIILNKNLVALNYWTFTDSSTQLWTAQGEPKQGVAVLKRYFKPVVVHGMVTDEKGRAIDSATVESTSRVVTTEKGSFTIPLAGTDTLKVSKSGYSTQEQFIQTDGDNAIDTTIVLVRGNVHWWERLLDLIRSHLP